MHTLRQSPDRMIGALLHSVFFREEKMNDNELKFDRSCHVLYSKQCKNEILGRITLHYPEDEREAGSRRNK